MVSDLNTFTNNRCKIATQKKFFWANFAFLPAFPLWANFASLPSSLGEFCLTGQDFFGIGAININININIG